jgi:hypothetical protein
LVSDYCTCNTNAYTITKKDYMIVRGSMHINKCVCIILYIGYPRDVESSDSRIA